MLPAIFGLLGVVAGCFLSAWLTAYWSKRNWQLGKAAEAYANLFPTGRREIILLKHIGGGHILSQNCIQELDSSLKRLGGKIDSAFLRYLQEAWFFEKDAYLQNRISDLQSSFENYWDYCRLWAEQSAAQHIPIKERDYTFNAMHEERQKMIDEYKGPNGEQLLSQLDELKNDIAKKYFH